VTATDTAIAIGERSVDTILAVLVEPAGELQQNFGFARGATGQRGRAAIRAAKEDRSR
jgi:hypothetical protein